MKRVLPAIALIAALSMSACSGGREGAADGGKGTHLLSSARLSQDGSEDALTKASEEFVKALTDAA